MINNISKTYADNFNPFTYTGEDGYKTMWESSHIEVGVRCFHHPGLKGDENTILLYSALLSLRNDPAITFSDMELGVCYYDIFKMAKLLNMNIVTACQSINKLKELNLISVVDNVRYSSFIGLMIHKDLRYDSDSKKDIIRVYDRMFFYPSISKEAVMLYSFYLKQSKTLSRQEYKAISHQSASEVLGYSEEKTINILKEMEYMGLVTITKHFYSETVDLAVDFSLEQPEEKSFKRDLDQQEKRRKAKEQEWQPKLDPEIEDEFSTADRAYLEDYEKWLQNHPEDDFDPLDVKVHPEDKNYFVKLYFSGKGSNLLYPEVTIKPSPGIPRYVW